MTNVGHSNSELFKRVKDYNRKWLGKGLFKSIRSSMAQHLVETNHPVDINQAFPIIHRI